MPSPYGKRTNVRPLLLVLNFSSVAVALAGRIEVSSAIPAMKGALLQKTKRKTGKEKLHVVKVVGLFVVVALAAHQSDLRLPHPLRRGLPDPVASVEVTIRIAIAITIALTRVFPPTIATI